MTTRSCTAMLPVRYTSKRTNLHAGRLRWPFIASQLISVYCLVPADAQAHVKWFAPYDVHGEPLPVLAVVNTQYVTAFVGFLLLISGGFILDRLATRWWPGLMAPGEQGKADMVLRAGVGAFFVALFATGGVILTPELQTTAEWTSWIQFGIALSMISARTCVLGGIGILVLYGYAIRQYGLFHLADYPMFLGIAAYMILTSCPLERIRAARMPIIYVTVCSSLMWVAVEKWAYPQWTYPLFAERPYLTFGVPVGNFVVLAGFVEFALAFYILFGLGLLRIAILGFGLIFVAAVADFGKIDAIGHLPVIAAFAAMFLHGPTVLHRAFLNARGSLYVEARRAGVYFVGAICLFFVAYYGLQRTGFGGPPGMHHLTSVESPLVSR